MNMKMKKYAKHSSKSNVRTLTLFLITENIMNFDLIFVDILITDYKHYMVVLQVVK